ncbi:MAG: IS30 family transposase [Clostridia bacterium]|nr:IS30 family transposase [Clostridia bacterium]
MKQINLLTLTLDNGTEFLRYKDIEKETDLKIYIADTHSPWQRDCNENINGFIRFFFPRGTDFRNLPQEQLDSVVSLINNRPHKCLGYLSPIGFINNSAALTLTI